MIAILTIIGVIVLLKIMKWCVDLFIGIPIAELLFKYDNKNDKK